MLVAVRATVSKIMMLPMDEDGAGGGCVESGDVALGVGAGYARKELSFEGESAQMAVSKR